MEDAPENSCQLHDAEDALLFDDNLAISVEELNAFLDEPQIPPSSDARSQVTFDGAHLGKPDVTVDPANASKSFAGFRKFDEAVGSQWSTPSFCDVTDSKNEVNLGFSLGSAESFNCHLFPTSSNISHASEHADTKSTLACPSNWFSLSNQEYDLGSMKDLVGSYHDSLMGTDFHNQQAEYISGHSFDTAGDTGLAFPGYAGFHRDLCLDSGQKELKRAKEYTPCADDSSHTLMTELSSLTDSERHDDRRATRANSLLHDRSLHPYSSMVPNSTYLNLMNSNSDLNYTDTTNVMYNASGSSYLSCGGSSIGHSKNGLWNTLNHQFPQLIVKRKDGIEDHLHPFSSNSVVELDSRMESTGSFLQDFPMEDIVEPFIDLCTEQNHIDDVSLKSESSIDSSPLPSSRNSTSDDAHVFSVDESEELFPDALANLQNAQKKTTLRFERGIQVHVSQYQQNTLLRHSENDGLKGNCAINYVNVDDDLDICIIDDIRNPTYPPPRPPPLLDVDNHTMLEQSGFTDTYHPRFGGMRYKADDEKLTFRLMLQDLAQPNSNSEANPPEGVLTIPLLRHQRIALHWMVQKETASPHCCGGILADDQGLGKTVSTIALILTERSPSPSPFTSTGDQDRLEALNLDDEDDDDNVSETNGTKQLRICSSITTSLSKRRENSLMAVKIRPAAGTLVVCPTSVLRQWAEELKTKVASIANLSYLVYHGGSRTKDPNELAKYDVVLTTYAIVSMEVPKQPLGDKDDEEKLKADGIMGHTTDKKRKDSPCSTSRSSKNGNKKDCSLLESAARPLARVRWFRVILDEAQSIKNHRTQVARACWGLRAKRRWCLSGTPIQNAVDDLYSYFRFLRYDPYAVYKSFCSLIKIPISRNPANGYKKLQVLLKTIMLRRTKGSMLDGEPIINLPPKTVILKKVDFSEEERTFYTRLEAESREQFKVYANEGTVKQNYVNILLMLLRLRQACDHRILVNGYGSNFLGRSSVEMVKKLTKEKQKDLLSCLDARYAICTICNDPPEDAVVTICGHVFCNQCICELLNGDDSICPSAECKVRLDAASVFSRHTLVTSISDMPGELCHSTACGFDVLDEVKVSRDSYSSKVKAAIEILQSLPRSQWSQNCNSVELKEEGQLQNGVKVAHGCFVDSNDRKKSGMTCQPSEKAIVFSQWTRMLDLLEVPLKDSCIQYRRLDGTMSVAAREKAIKDFNNIPEVTVMIMSLKAASLGLNLVVACHVLLLDLWWNPTTEDQAIDRAHRIGQRRPVTVSRLTVKDTVEDRILALQEKKREMVASAFGEDESGSRQTRLTVEDLNYLFMV